MKHFLRLLAVSFIALGFYSTAVAQNLGNFPSTVSVTNGPNDYGVDSDYFVYFHWDDFTGSANINGNCTCTNPLGPTRQIKIFKPVSPCASWAAAGDLIWTSPQTAGAAGSYTYGVGPEVLSPSSYAMMLKVYIDCDCFLCTDCNSENYWTCFGSSVAPIRIRPPSISSAFAVSLTEINIQWTRDARSDVPLNKLRWRVYRSNGSLAYETSTDGETEWTETGLTPGTTHSYDVKAFYTDGTSESLPGQSYVVATTHALSFDASDHEFTTKTRLEWTNVSSITNEIVVQREDPISFLVEDIATLSGSETFYEDYDGVPGRQYVYRIKFDTPYGQEDLSNAGTRKSNGRISGEVKTLFGAGVEGVEVIAAYGPAVWVLDTTDATGYYNITNIFYGEEGEIQITPSKPEHGFNPAAATRTLDLLNPVVVSVNFTDTTVFTVYGKAEFPERGSPLVKCPIDNAQIILDGTATGYLTNSMGEYAVAIQNPGTHTIGVFYEGLAFENPSVTLDVYDDVELDFESRTTDTLIVSLKGGCDNIVAHHANFRISSVVACFDTTITTNGLFPETVVLPAQEYTIELTNAFSDVQGNNSIPEIVTFFENDDITVDLLVRDSIVSPSNPPQMIPGPATKVDFIYHPSLTMTVVNSAEQGSSTPQCLLDQGISLMQQRVPEVIEVTVHEEHTYGGTPVTCLVDGGTVSFNDQISTPELNIPLPLNNGVAVYNFTPGTPNIAGDFTKSLFITAEVGNLQVQETITALVEGHQPGVATFTTVSPELPLMILHDPPGDASYAYMYQDSTYTTAFSHSIQSGGGNGPYADILIGTGVDIPFTGQSLGAAAMASGSIMSGTDNDTRKAINTTITTTQQISTSSDEDFIGVGGDIFMGAAFNEFWAPTTEIYFDETLSPCGGSSTLTVSYLPGSIATTYIYTENHIKETLIPQLQSLYEIELNTAAEPEVVFELANQIDVWQQVLDINADNIETATQVTNISFSSGAIYESSTTLSTESTSGIEYQAWFDTTTSVGARIGDGGAYLNEDLGYVVNMRHNTIHAYDTTSATVGTFGYHLEDDDTGDFFSVDVKKDKVYGTPAFDLIGGTSSCPHEPGTQARDSVQMSIEQPEVFNVPPNDPAVFVLHLDNLSQSMEEREYGIRLVNGSSLDGAIIKIGGQIITSSGVNYTIPYGGGGVSTLLTVERGPFANNYNNLQVYMYAPCEALGTSSEGWNITQSDTVKFSARFQNECSDIELYQPINNYVVNAASNNAVAITLSGYNVNNPNLEEIQFQYRRIGQTWTTLTAETIAVSPNTPALSSFIFDISGISDGSYEFRAASYCGTLMGMNYSSVHSVTIDRSSVTLFGTPTPTDGVLNFDDEITVTFNEEIDCNLQFDPVDITLVVTETGDVIPNTFVCSGNTILIEVDPAALDALENVNLTATVSNLSDVNGNELSSPVVWSFTVNRGQVYWDPSNAVVTAVVNQTANFTSELRNVSASAQNYTLTQMPDWLTTTQTSGSVPNGGVVPIDFEIIASLDLGIYEDTVIATINNQEQFLYVHAEVTAVAPDWTVNPADFQYSLSLTGQFSLTELDAPLSSDTRDMIAAFVDGECRGVANIVYVPNLNVYSAFMTVYSNQLFGEELDFRFWDAYPGTEYQAQQPLPPLVFSQGQSLGQSLSPYILHPGGVFQSIDFVPGWNWFSLNVLADDMSVNSVLSTVIGHEGEVVKTHDAATQYSDVLEGWWNPLVATGGETVGLLAEFDNDHSYQIEVTEASTLRLLGEPLVDHVVPIVAGWNWLGYPRLGINPIGEILDSYTATEGDQIKGDGGFANYVAGSWEGSLEAFKPGRGYKLKTVNPGGIQFVGSTAPPTPPLEDCGNFQLFENNMTVTAKLTNNGIDVFDSHFIVSASINDSCRAWAQPEFIPELNAYRMLLTLPGYLTNTGEAISFEVEDLDNGNIYIPEYTPVSFNSDDVVGDLTSAFVLNINTVGIEETLNIQGHWLGQNVPNPFNDQTLIPYSIGKSTNVQLEVYDMIGNRVMQLVSQSQAAGTYQVSFNRDVLAGGMYMYVLSTDQGRQTKRMLLTD